MRINKFLGRTTKTAIRELDNVASKTTKESIENISKQVENTLLKRDELIAKNRKRSSELRDKYRKKIAYDDDYSVLDKIAELKNNSKNLDKDRVEVRQKFKDFQKRFNEEKQYTLEKKFYDRDSYNEKIKQKAVKTNPAIEQDVVEQLEKVDTPILSRDELIAKNRKRSSELRDKYRKKIAYEDDNYSLLNKVTELKNNSKNLDKDRVEVRQKFKDFQKRFDEEKQYALEKKFYDRDSYDKKVKEKAVKERNAKKYEEGKRLAIEKIENQRKYKKGKEMAIEYLNQQRSPSGGNESIKDKVQGTQNFVYKMAAMGVGGGLVLNLANNKGQQTNNQLYGM